MKLLEDFLNDEGHSNGPTYSKRLNIGFQPDSYCDFDLHPEFAEVFSRFTRHDPYRGMDVSRLWCFILNLKHVVSQTDGAIAELGVHKGHSAAVLGFYARRFQRKLYLIDTFTGFAQEQLETGLADSKKNAFQDTSLDLAKETVGESPLFRWVVGAFPASITNELEADRFSFVSLDCDLYEPMILALRFFYERLNGGGLIFVHDYSSNHWPGAKQAVDEFLQEQKAGAVLLADKSGSIVLTKV